MTKTTKPRSFDADAKTKELQDGTVTISGREYHPALLTPDVRREQIEIRVRTAKLLNANNLNDPSKPDTDADLDQRVDTIGQVDDSLYSQLAVLLRDEDEQRPDLDVLRELDQRVARDLLNWLEEDDGAAGEEKPASTLTPAAT